MERGRERGGENQKENPRKWGLQSMSKLGIHKGCTFHTRRNPYKDLGTLDSETTLEGFGDVEETKLVSVHVPAAQPGYPSQYV